MRRRLLLIFLGLLAGLVVLVISLPLWLGAVAGFAGRSRGLTFAAYERIGYSRFVLRDVEYRRPGLRVTASRVEAETPLVWWWHRARGRPEVISAGEWLVEVSRRERPRPPPPDRGWMRLRALLQRIAVQLDRWLPQATAGAGLVRWSNGEISASSAQWAGRKLKVDDLTFRSLNVDASLAFSDDTLRVTAQMGEETATAKLESRGADVNGEIVLWEQPATLRARFDPKGWLPAEAALQAEEWTLPGDRLNLGTAYAAVHGSALMAWRAGRFETDLDVSGEPIQGKAAPPLQLVLRGNGDMQAFTIESLNASLPGINALLSEPVTVQRSGQIGESAARFDLQADLAKVPWFSATGEVTGEARLVSGLSAAPVVEFSFNASDISARGVSLAAVAGAGRLDWPRLQLREGFIIGRDGERLALGGGWDFRAKEIFDASLEGQIRRQSLARWLPPQPEFDIVELRASASGPIASLEHSGSLEASGVRAPALHPLDVAAEWRGRGATIESFKVKGDAGGSALVAAGKADATSLTLSTLDFIQGDSPRLQLTSPAVLRWRPKLQLESLRLAGPAGSLDILATAGQTGRIEIAAQNVSSHWFSDLLVMRGPPWAVSLLALDGSWDHGPMAFSVTAGASLEIGEAGDTRSAAVNVAARGGTDGIRIQALRATEADATVINATGRLPITFLPGGGQFMRIEPDGALVLDATVAPNAAFWQKLAEVSGVDLQDPQASAHLTGTWRQPEGNVSLRAGRITIDPKRVARPLPAIEALELEVTGDRSGVTLRQFSLLVEGQAVRGEGRLPIPEGEWNELFKSPLAAARQGADLQIVVPDAEIAVFTRFLPAVLAPKGRLQADVRYRNGDLEGVLRLRDAASRPLGPLGVLQEISADLAMTGRRFALRGVTAKSGGQPVTLSGMVELPESGSPRFDLTLRGENLPFVRQTGVLIRGDLDLKLQTRGGGQPRLSGNVRLRDSLFLADVRAFLPKGGASASRRPPYFAIETPPVNLWTLAIDVQGERFLRLRTPVFAGLASARFRLSGTLGEPRAIGEVEIDEGSVRMPFATFGVTQGSIRLTEADPYEPAVYLRGTGRRYGYDLIMEIDGSASQPNVMFTSSPPLDSEQVLLMVMTGAAPSNEMSRSASQRVANIGLFLGKSLLGSLGADSADADRLSFESGEKISRQGRETYDIEYKLSDRWTLTGEYNEFDEYNGGVKWRAFGGKRPGGNKDANH